MPDGASSSIPIPIDTESEPPAPPGVTQQSGDTAPPPPELAVTGGEAQDGADIEAMPPPDPTPVDFDALHAALGEGSREAAPMGTPPPAVAAAATQSQATKPARAAVAESQGRSSATYASSRAQAPPVAHIDADLSAPAVIVADDAAMPAPTVPIATPQLTAPMAPPVMPNHPSSGPYAVGTPSSGGMMAAPSHLPTGNTPDAFNPAALGLPPVRPGQVQLTMRMPERPRRPRTPTVVVRQRGPSTRQKVLVFSIMLLLVSAIGLAIVILRAPQLFGLGPKPAPATAKPAISVLPITTATNASSASSVVVPSGTPSAAAAPSAAPSASASAKPILKLPKAK